jgi:hypothetical protein
MSFWRRIHSFPVIFANPTVRGIALTLYYLLIILGLILLYGKGDFSTPKFIYQGF